MFRKPLFNVFLYTIDMKRVIIAACWITVMFGFNAQAKPELFAKHRFGNQSAVLVVDDAGNTHYSLNEDKLLIPASTIKIATSIGVIEKLGLDYQFETDFYQHDSRLWVKGYGDPYLVSEELDIIAKVLLENKKIDFNEIHSINIDGSYFPELKVPGRNISTQPYDAPLSAVSANFNTIKIKKIDGSVFSAEKQTPITSLAKTMVRHLGDGVHRINLVKASNSERYFAELLLAKLQEHGLKKKMRVEFGIIPENAEHVYKHKNSHTVEDALRGMMLYSNNFIANQLFLQLREEGSNISFDVSSQYMSKLLSSNLVLSSASSMIFADGSGLSRQNKLSAKQLLVLLNKFEPYKGLMKPYLDGKAFAKSGSLNGVHNLAGYVSKNNKEYKFVFLFNESVPWRYRNTLLKELYATL